MKTPDEIKKSLRMCTEYKCAPSCLSYEVETNCRDALMEDALAYIEQLESRVEPKNRVLTLEELKVYTGFLWNENRFDYEGEPAFVEKGFMYAGNGNVDLRRDISDAYGKNWRCWLRKPTKEEMEGTPCES